MAMEINSSLDLFLLGLIQSGVNTPYLFHERTRLSVGATLPALERLERNGLISRAENGLRNKQEFAVTATGRRAFGSQLVRILQEYRGRPPSDYESVFRVASLALRVRESLRCGRDLSCCRSCSRPQICDSRNQHSSRQRS